MKTLKVLAIAIVATCFFSVANAQVVVRARIGTPPPHRVVVVHRPPVYHHRRPVVVYHRRPVYRHVRYVHRPVVVRRRY